MQWTNALSREVQSSSVKDKTATRTRLHGALPILNHVLSRVRGAANRLMLHEAGKTEQWFLQFFFLTPFNHLRRQGHQDGMPFAKTLQLVKSRVATGAIISGPQVRALESRVGAQG